MSLFKVLKLEQSVPEGEIVQIDFHYYDVCHSDIHQVDNDCGKTVAARDYLPGFAPKPKSQTMVMKNSRPTVTCIAVRPYRSQSIEPSGYDVAYIRTHNGTERFVKSRGEGRLVILPHGWQLAAEMWDAEAMALANASYRTITYIRRGLGRLGQPWNGKYDTFADDLFDVMQEGDRGARELIDDTARQLICELFPHGER